MSEAATKAQLRRLLVSLCQEWGMNHTKVWRMPLPATIYDDVWLLGNEDGEDTILATERVQTYLKSKGC